MEHCNLVYWYMQCTGIQSLSHGRASDCSEALCEALGLGLGLGLDRDLFGHIIRYIIYHSSDTLMLCLGHRVR
jgi:hypothetical protein